MTWQEINAIHERHAREVAEISSRIAACGAMDTEDDGPYYVLNNLEGYGSGYPVCVDKKERDRLNAAWGCGNDVWHTATADEMSEYGTYDSDQCEERKIDKPCNTEAKRLASEIREKPVWDMDLLQKLCDLAGISDEWDAADGESFEAVAYKAAAILGVEI